MRQLSAEGRQLIQHLAQRHGFSEDGVLSMLQSVINGNGTMAQFNHPDFAGPGQWMRGGMTMVSDMFNTQLKGRVDSLCTELSKLVAKEPNLFVPATRENTGQWWPEELGQPSSSGSQNEIRYAYFPQARRLAINVKGKISVYDTQDHQIGGFAQQQAGGASVTFTSQYGLVSLFNLPIISGESLVAAPSSLPPPAQVSAAASQTTGRQESKVTVTPHTENQDIFATIEKLAGLLEKGYLSPEEFAEKKKELLSRL